MVSKPFSASASASSWACRRTRCWVARVPLRSARYVCSDTASNDAEVCETTGCSPRRRLQSASSATLSASGTVDGSISNALDQVTSPCGGSGASSTRPPPARLVTRAMSRAWRTRLAASCGPTSTVAAKPTAPSTTTRTPMPNSVSSAVVSGWASRRRTVWLRMRSTRSSAAWQPAGSVERGIGQRGQLVGGQRHQATGVGWRTGSPAAV